MTDRLPPLPQERLLATYWSEARDQYVTVWGLQDKDLDEWLAQVNKAFAEIAADRDSWIEQASARAQETVEAMQQVEAYRLRCEAQDSAAFELVAVEDPDAGTIYRMGERIAELEAEVAALHSAPREPLTDEQCDSIYSALHEWAQECDRHELGLPMFGDEKTRGREVIRRASERAHNIGADAGDDQGREPTR